jgi:hypothetical protein
VSRRRNVQRSFSVIGHVVSVPIRFRQTVVGSRTKGSVVNRPTSRELALFGSLLTVAACALEVGGVGLPVTSPDSTPDGSAAADAIAPEDDSASPDLDTGTQPSFDASADALDTGADQGDGTADGSDAALPIVVSSYVIGGIGFDKVGVGDQELDPNFFDDGVFALEVNGPIDGIILVTTNGTGQAQGSYQWDTVVLNDPLPDIGTGATIGSNTSILGIWDSSDQRVNDNNGRVSLGPGPHALTAYADSFYGGLVAGQHYIFWVHVVGGDWASGDVFKW